MNTTPFSIEVEEVDSTGKVLRVIRQHYVHCDLTDEEFTEVGERISQAVSEETDKLMKDHLCVGLKEYSWENVKRADKLMKDHLCVGLKEYSWENAKRDFYKTADPSVDYEREDTPAAAEVRRIEREWRKAKKDWTREYWSSKESELKVILDRLRNYIAYTLSLQ